MLEVAQPWNEEDEVQLINNSRLELRDRYESSEADSALGHLIYHARRSIYYTQQTVATLDTTSTERALYLFRLAYRLQQQYDLFQLLPDLDQVIVIRRDCVNANKEDDLNKALCLCFLSDCLAQRFKRCLLKVDIEEAVECAAYAVRISSCSDPKRLFYCMTLKKRLDCSFGHFGDVKVREQAVAIKRTMMDEVGAGHEEEPYILEAIAQELFAIYKTSRNVDELDQAILLMREACDITTSELEERFLLLNFLGSLYSTRSEDSTSFAGDLENAVSLKEEALKLCPLQSPRRVGLLINTMNLHRQLYESGHGASNLQRGIKYGREAIEKASLQDPNHTMWLQDFAICLTADAEENGKDEALDEAIKLLRDGSAVATLTKVDKAMICNNLSTSLQARYERSGSVLDIEEAVVSAEEAVALTPSYTLTRPIYVNSLGSAQGMLYYRRKDPDLLNEAILRGREALRITTEKSPDRGMYLNNLAARVWARYIATRSPEDRSEALLLARQSIAATGQGRPQLVIFIHNLGAKLYEIYMADKSEGVVNMQDLNSAISLGQQCVELTPEDHFSRSQYLLALSWRQLQQAGDTENATQFSLARSNFKAGFDNESGRLQHRIEGGRACALCMMFEGLWVEANEMCKKVLVLMGRISPRSISRDDMRYRLSDMSNTSTFAAVAVLQIGEPPDVALARLELGRGFIAGFFMDIRTDLSELAIFDPDLYEKYQDLRKDVAKDLPAITIAGRQIDVLLQRREQVKRLTDMEDRIRKLPKFLDFQLPLSSKRLHILAEFGPIVCFNVTEFRSDAFIVKRDEVKSLSLPLLIEKELKENVRKVIGANRLTRCSLLQRGIHNELLRSILAWLWQVAVKPVLDDFGFVGRVDESTSHPRIWWVTSGQMGLMPLHAAGSGWGETKENTASRVISSYIPTLRSLEYARSQDKIGPHRTLSADRSILVVNVPKTPAAGCPILRTEAEVEAISQSAHDSGIPIEIPGHPRISDTLESMRKHSIIHFACHGEPDLTDPSQTSLLVWKDVDNVDRLTVARLNEENHDHAQLAYLSACCTAQQYVLGLIDESLHLGSAFQLMGFPSVIATLWEADDGAAAAVAAEFYKRFLGPLNGMRSSEAAARCLHEATQIVRTRKKGRGKASDDVIAWAPFVHVGA